METLILGNCLFDQLLVGKFNAISIQEGALVENERESRKLRKEHNTVIADLESKLQTAEKEAAVREDSLRLEVEELRKRWQDAVRRADGTPFFSFAVVFCRLICK